MVTSGVAALSLNAGARCWLLKVNSLPYQACWWAPSGVRYDRNYPNQQVQAPHFRRCGARLMAELREPMMEQAACQLQYKWPAKPCPTSKSKVRVPKCTPVSKSGVQTAPQNRVFRKCVGTRSQQGILVRPLPYPFLQSLVSQVVARNS